MPTTAESLPLLIYFLPLVDGFNDLGKLESALNQYQFFNRDIVEKNKKVIQPIPIAVIITTKKDKILCIKKTPRSTPKNSPESGKLLFYAGGHMRQEDETINTKRCFIKTIQNTLERELFEELGISISLDNVAPDFCLYTPQYSENSKKHLAIGWIILLPEGTKLNLDSYEIVQRKGKSKSGSFLSFSEIEKQFSINDGLVFESWTKEILLNFFKDEFSEMFINNIDKISEAYQLSLFDD